ncbi:MAG: DUF151 domain-containing protein, partial [Calditrichales bacterium]|nr:DUF151 domain-containing protein [Calditrichales bacterium]
NTLNMIGVKIEKVLISELRDNTYYAILTLLKEAETLEIDARPSDAIALAVRVGASIFVNDVVMDQASYIPDEKEETDKNYLFKSNANYIESLKLELQKAVESEEYEKAATLRDKIKRLESSS